MERDRPPPHRAQRRAAHTAVLAVLIAVAALLRVVHAVGQPLGPDEVGVGVLQASGQAEDYLERLPEGIVPIAAIRSFVAYDERRGPGDVLRSLRYAGMHPPFYYLLLHGALRLVGNGALPLRLLSVAVSLASLLACYALAAALWDRRVAAWATLFLAVSAYAVKFGATVRPYPLLTLLSLLLAWQAIPLARAPDLSALRGRLAGFALTTWIGLFSLYHFAFVAASLWGLVLAAQHRSPRAVASLVICAGAVALAYAPWLPALADQLEVVGAGRFYFYGDVDSGTALAAVVRHDFLGPALPGWAGRALAAAAVLGALVGAAASLRRPASRGFVLAFAGYLALHAGADVATGMRTLTFPALLFWVVPVSLLLLAAGVSALPGPAVVRNALLAGFAAALLAQGAHLALQPTPTGLVERVAAHLESGDRALVLYNTRQRRFLFSFVHALDAPVDFWILDLPKLRREGFEAPAAGRYDRVLLVHDVVADEPATTYAPDDVQRIRAGLRRHGYRPVAEENVGRSGVMEFRGS